MRHGGMFPRAFSPFYVLYTVTCDGDSGNSGVGGGGGGAVCSYIQDR